MWVKGLCQHKEVDMLALRFSPGDYVFVYSKGRPLGAILVGDCSRKGRFPLLFCGGELDFEILRPSVVEHRYGSEELERLIEDFSLQAPGSFTSQQSLASDGSRPADGNGQARIGGHRTMAMESPRN